MPESAISNLINLPCKIRFFLIGGLIIIAPHTSFEFDPFDTPLAQSHQHLDTALATSRVLLERFTLSVQFFAMPQQCLRGLIISKYLNVQNLLLQMKKNLFLKLSQLKTAFFKATKSTNKVYSQVKYAIIDNVCPTLFKRNLELQKFGTQKMIKQI